MKDKRKPNFGNWVPKKQPGHKGHTLQTVSSPDNAIKHEPACCICYGRPLDGVGHRKIGILLNFAK